MRKLLTILLISAATLLKGQDTLFIPIIADTIKNSGVYYLDTKLKVSNDLYLHIRTKLIINTPQDTVFIRPKGFKQL